MVASGPLPARPIGAVGHEPVRTQRLQFADGLGEQLLAGLVLRRKNSKLKVGSVAAASNSPIVWSVGTEAIVGRSATVRPMQLTASDPTSAAFRDRVDAEIDAYLTRLTGRLEPVSPALTQLTRVARDLSSGGKRLRPAFRYGVSWRPLATGRHRMGYGRRSPRSSCCTW